MSDEYSTEMSDPAEDALGEFSFKSARVSSGPEFAQFADDFYRYYKDRGHEWENANLEAYLEALAAVAHAYRLEPLTWSLLARILISASAYE